MSIVEDTDAYETWLKGQCDVDRKGLEKKRALMALDPFRFLRATCYRFARELPRWRPELARHLRVPSCGDAHVDNFGTWRDAEGRLVWGLNDFDDAALLPFSYDLVRLAVSARLSPYLRHPPPARIAFVLAGYARGLQKPGPTFVDADVPWMGSLLKRKASRYRRFFGKVRRYHELDPPAEVRLALVESLPAGADIVRFVTRRAGGGSLGRRRWLAVARWRGGWAVREAKALVPSSWSYAAGAAETPIPFLEIATTRHRSPDPHLGYGAGCVVRRLAPDSRKLDLCGLDDEAQEEAVLRRMGRELAGVHLGGQVSRADLSSALASLPGAWLEDASAKAEAETRCDHLDWARRGRARSASRPSSKCHARGRA